MHRRIATLRQRAAHLLCALRQLPAGQPAEIVPTLLANAHQIFKLTYIAVGDADSAAVLTADVLAQAPANEGAALRQLIQRLPQGWLSWPGAAGPSEWLRLRLRREQADRLLSVLGEWDAEERIALGLYLLWDVRRDDLDSWLGTKDMADRVLEFIGYVGEGLGIVERGGEHETCKEIAADLLEANDPQTGRTIRLHMIGCEACRRRAHGLQRTATLLRNALDVFFRAPLPKNFEQLIRTCQKQRQLQPLKYWKPALTAMLVLALWIGIGERSASTEAEIAQAATSIRAPELIDRALNRFTEQPLHTGILHERLRVGKDERAMLVERWYDYRSPQRLRVIVRRPEQTTPVFDLATDGSSWIAYEVNNGLSRPVSTLVRNPEIATLMPLLRQLPFVGSFSETPVDQDSMDLTLLAQARRGRPVMLGTTTWKGRSAYMLSSVTRGVGRTILTLDRETLSLLEARVGPDTAGATQIDRVWEAEVVEVVPRSAVRSDTFQLTARRTVVTQIDPRQFVLYPAANLDIDTAVRYSSLPVPEFLPDKTLSAHLRGISGINAALLQMYQSQWSTLAIVTPRIVLRPVPRERLDREFAHGSYMARTLELPQATIAWFVMNDAPNRVVQLYLWHAFADEAEREQMVRQILDSLVLVDESNAAKYRERFPAESADGKPGSLIPAQESARSNVAPLSPAQAARRRYLRSKLEQSYGTEPPPSGFGTLIR